jgi:hypothetical protein
MDGIILQAFALRNTEATDGAISGGGVLKAG